MTLEQRQVVYAAALEKWGIDAQVGMLQEECIELALAIRKMQRGSSQKNFEAFIDEVADVQIMIEQVRSMGWDKQIDERVEYKINRLQKTMQKVSCKKALDMINKSSSDRSLRSDEINYLEEIANGPDEDLAEIAYIRLVKENYTYHYNYDFDNLLISDKSPEWEIVCTEKDRESLKESSEKFLSEKEHLLNIND